MKIYLAGSFPKSKTEEVGYKSDWRKKISVILSNVFEDAVCIDPFEREIDETDYKSVVGKDCLEIKESDLVIINGTYPIGVGTAQEILIAKYFKKPVISILPKNSFCRRDTLRLNNKEIKDWIHPFINEFSDFIIEDISEIKKIKKKISEKKTKGIDEIDKLISYFESTN